MNRGYFGCGVFNPQKSANIGTLLRSAFVLGAAFTFTVSGRREAIEHASNTVRSERHLPHFHFADMEAACSGLPTNCPLVAIELCDGATSLDTYQHRERAAYLLGPENGTLGPEVLALCADKLVIPHAQFCFNVAVAGSIVMWHRATQRSRP